MPEGGNAAIGYAKQLDEIGFPEFTTKLVSDVFDSLIASNIRQQQAFIELLQATSKSLKDFVNDTKDDIGPAEIMQMLSAVLPPANPTPDSPPSKVAVGTTLTAAEATTLNTALEVKDAGVDADNKVAAQGSITQAKYDALLEAVAVRIAANKYTLLTEMVKQGMLRLVVDDGTIETRLNFKAYGSDYFGSHSSRMSRSDFSFRANAQSGGLVSAWVKASASTAYNSMTVSTASASRSSRSGLEVDIFGGVKINFHTDYLPLKPVE